MPLPLDSCVTEGCWRLTATSTTEGILYARIGQMLPFGPAGLIGSAINPNLVENQMTSGTVAQLPTLADVTQGKLAGNITPY